MYAPDSIDLLTKSGIDFQRHEEIGLLPAEFAELLITSGLVLSDEAKWISFHSGYDFGYLLKLLTSSPLPPVESDFFDLLKIWFPNVFDIKYIMRTRKVLKGGLQDVADELGVCVLARYTLRTIYSPRFPLFDRWCASDLHTKPDQIVSLLLPHSLKCEKSTFKTNSTRSNLGETVPFPTLPIWPGTDPPLLA